MDTSIRRRAPFIEQTTEFVLTPAQIRTLNSVPIDLVVPANSKTFIRPMECVFVGARGNGAYSGFPSITIQYSDSTVITPAAIDANGAWDGSAVVLAITSDPLANNNTGDISNARTDKIGLALQVISGGDVTGGDALCKIKLTYRSYDFSGDL